MVDCEVFIFIWFIVLLFFNKEFFDVCILFFVWFLFLLLLCFFFESKLGGVFSWMFVVDWFFFLLLWRDELVLFLNKLRVGLLFDVVNVFVLLGLLLRVIFDV